MSQDQVNDWDINPDNYARDFDGNFVLKKDGTPAKKRGRKPGEVRVSAIKANTNPDGTFKKNRAHSETIIKKQVKGKIKAQKDGIEKLRKTLESKQRNYKNTLNTASKLDEKLGSKNNKKSAIVSESDLEALPPKAKEWVEKGQVNVAFMANPGPQTDFLASDEDEVLYGGAAGGGKSYAMLADPLRYVSEHDHRAIILRRSMPELRELIDKSHELYPAAYPGAKYNQSEKIWKFPSGCKIEFGFLETDADVYRYQGLPYSFIGYDELTHLATSFPWDYLRSRLRTVNPNIKVYMRATTNPGGVGHDWVKKRFIDPAPPNTRFMCSEGLISRRFIPARLSDNPALNRDGQYERMLRSMDPVHRERLLNGDWNINEGAAFSEFNTEVHVIVPFDIPPHWERFKCIDYGYRAPSCCLWIAVDPADGTLIVYRELYQKGLDGSALAERLHDMEAEEMRSIGGVLDGAAWNMMGGSGPTVGEALIKSGHKLRRADKNRIAGKIQVHERLKLDPKTHRPRTQFFNTCPDIIRELTSIPVDPKNKEDVDTKASDHAYDAFRYGCMSRPRMDDPIRRMQRFKSQIYRPFDRDFGY